MEKMTLKQKGSQNLSAFWETIVLPILKYKKLTYLIVSSAVSVALIYCLAVSNQFTSVATILPSGNVDGMSDLKNLAAGSLSELGLGSLMKSSEGSSELYPKVLESRLISEKVLMRSYSFKHNDKMKNLSLYDYIEEDNLDKSIEGLRQLVGISTDKRTGVLYLSVTTKYPGLSSSVVNAYLEELDNYNINHRKSKAAAKEEFLTGRLSEVSLELKAAEDSLLVYQQVNRNYLKSSDPELQIELVRRKREVELKSAVYLTLFQQYELARLEAARDIPIVQVLDRGFEPIVKSSPFRKNIMIASLMGSFLFSVLLSLWLDLWNRRQVRKNIATVMSSPSVQLNRIEATFVDHLSRLADTLKKNSLLENRIKEKTAEVHDEK